MAESFNGSDYGILNWDSPTRAPPNVSASVCTNGKKWRDFVETMDQKRDLNKP